MGLVDVQFLLCLLACLSLCLFAVFLTCCLSFGQSAASLLTLHNLSASPTSLRITVCAAGPDRLPHVSVGLSCLLVFYVKHARSCCYNASPLSVFQEPSQTLLCVSAWDLSVCCLSAFLSCSAAAMISHRPESKCHRIVMLNPTFWQCLFAKMLISCEILEGI